MLWRTKLETELCLQNEKAKIRKIAKGAWLLFLITILPAMKRSPTECLGETNATASKKLCTSC
jgi:hypothetical protein